MRHVREQAAASFLESPTAGEEEHAEADETEGAAHLVEEIAEVEPCDGGAEIDSAEVYEAAAGLRNSPPDDEDAEGCDKGVRSEIRAPCASRRARVAVMLGQQSVCTTGSAMTNPMLARTGIALLRRRKIENRMGMAAMSTHPQKRV